MQASRDQYHANIRRWQAGAVCRENNFLYLALQAIKLPVRRHPVAQYCNKSADCQRGIQLRIRVQASPSINFDCPPSDTETPHDVLLPPANLPSYRSSGVTIVPGSVSQKLSIPSQIVSYTLEGNWCDYRAYWDAVNPFDTVYVKFRLRFPFDGVVGDSPYGMTAWLDGQVGGAWLQAADKTKLLIKNSASLRCGTAGV